MREILSVDEVAEILGTTPRSLRTMLSAGRDVPPNFNIGRRRVFLRRAVYAWLDRKAGVSGRAPGGRYRGASTSMKEKTTMSELFEVAEGDVFRDAESGEELTVVKLYAARGYAVLEDSGGDERTLNIQRLLDAVEGGDLVRVAEAAESEDADDPEESDEDEEG